jgi:hypothetical protein
VAEARQRRADQPIDLGRARYVARDGERVAAGRADALDERVEALLPACGDDDLRARAGQPERERLADARRRARHERDLSVEPERPRRIVHGLCGAIAR